MEADQLKDIANRFRTAILLHPKSTYPWNSSMGISQFPSGCCGDASQTLATYIFEQTGIVCSYAHGKNGGINSEIGSHAWLETDHLVIDITADQFKMRGYELEAVYVGPRTDWYNSFKITLKIDGRHSSLKNKGSLDAVYARICKGL
jgi:hypothetical protein